MSRHNIDIMTGGGMPFVPGAHPEYEAFYNRLSGFDKEAFKRFRRSHPTLSNQEAMSMFKLNSGHSHHMGMSHRLYPPRRLEKHEPLSAAFFMIRDSSDSFLNVPHLRFF